MNKKFLEEAIEFDRKYGDRIKKLIQQGIDFSYQQPLSNENRLFKKSQPNVNWCRNGF